MAGIMRIHSSWNECCAIPPLRQEQKRRKDGAPKHSLHSVALRAVSVLGFTPHYTNTETRLA
jgi:hypothetical protein